MPNPSVLAILARFDGNSTHALYYCWTMVAECPRLEAEYEQYAYTILEMKGSRI
jgi:hypothetical protein